MKFNARPGNNIHGTKFGRLLVVEFVGKKGAHYQWRCVCECGNEHLALATSLKTGNATQCRRCRYERTAAKNTIHGQARKTKEYHAWAAMKARCGNPNSHSYRNYGGRGIKVWKGWINDFQAFFDHMGCAPDKHHSVDRIDNNRGYVPGNVRWATQKEQARNTRANTLISAFGLNLKLCEWSERSGIRASVIHSRIKRSGWNPESAVSIPPSLTLKNWKHRMRNTRRTRRIRAFGKELCVSEWAEQTGVHPGTIRSRLRYGGWKMEDAVSSKADPHGKKHLVDRQ